MNLINETCMLAEIVVTTIWRISSGTKQYGKQLPTKGNQEKHLRIKRGYLTEPRSLKREAPWTELLKVYSREQGWEHLAWCCVYYCILPCTILNAIVFLTMCLKRFLRIFFLFILLAQTLQNYLVHLALRNASQSRVMKKLHLGPFALLDNLF